MDPPRSSSRCPESPVSPKTVPKPLPQRQEETHKVDSHPAPKQSTGGPDQGKKPTSSEEQPRPPLRLRTPVSSRPVPISTNSFHWPYSPHPALGSRTSASHTPGQDARSLEDLNNERSYLLHSLQGQDQRATHLSRRYVALEAWRALEPAAQGRKAARKAKKEAAMLQGRIQESVQQEKLIVLRLGELNIDIRHRQRWAQAWLDQRSKLAQHESHGAVMPQDLHLPTGCGYGPEAGATPHKHPDTPYAVITAPDYFTFPSALSPMSPVFIPGMTFPGEHRDDSRGNRQESLLDPLADVDDGGPTPTAANRNNTNSSAAARREEEEQQDDTGDEGKDQVNFDGVAWEFEPEEDKSTEQQSAEKRQRHRLSSSSLSGPFFFAARDKRMSLPSLKTLWPRSRRNSDTHACDASGENGDDGKTESPRKGNKSH